MAESVVAFAVKGLGVLVIQNAQFLYGISDQVEQVQAHLRQMQCFLKDADAKQDEHETIYNLVAEIREVAYSAEAVVETFVFELASRRGGFRKILIRSVDILSEVLARYRIRSEIETIKKNINILISSLQSYGLIAVMEREGTSSTYQRKLQFRRSYSHVIEEDFVGFQEDMKTLIKHLVNEREQNCQVVAICGMGGLGKTTLAKKIYHHQSIKNHFDQFAWVCISQQWQIRDILEGIFTKLVPKRQNQIANMRVEELVKQLYRVQQEKKCLVVIDDIWSSYAWDSLRAAFPLGSMGSKILITTRNKEVAMHIDPTCFLHEPKCLNEEESWELFQKKVFSRRDDADFKVDTRMEMLVREMVERCGGLPLAIVVLGGILVTKHTWSEWEIVHQNLNLFLRRGKSRGQQHGGVVEVLALSYHDLPYRLKACFLCLGNYPEDVEIEAEKLYQLWMAEGIILPSSLEDKEKGKEETMMDVAECYLDELAQRCILQVQLEEYPIRCQGRFKSCKLHDLMRDLCLLKIKEENFLKVVHLKRHKNEQQLVENSYPSSSLSSYRSSQIHRLAISFDENVDGDLSLLKQKQVQHIRSAVFFYGRRCSHRLWEQIKPCIFNHLKLLKVLDLEAMGHRFFSVSDLKLPKAIGNLIHLRYLGLRYSWFNKLPSSIGKLRYLQTLDLRTLSHPLMPNVLRKLKLLQHLYLPQSLRIENGGMLRLDGLDSLEMLENFHTYYCDTKDLFKLTNLRQLREAKMWGRHEDMINYLFSISNPNQQLFRHSSLSIRDSDIFSKESNLLTQLLGCHHVHKLEIQGPIQVLAPPIDHQIISLYSSSSLTQLCLEGSLLKEDPMSTLEKLPNLRSLDLDEAFVGKEMVCSAMGFPQLKHLKLKGLHNLVRWRVDERAMPNLVTIEIRSCKKLEMLPNKLRFVLPHGQVLIEGTPEECHYSPRSPPPLSRSRSLSRPASRSLSRPASPPPFPLDPWDFFFQPI
ncbi:putative disease resistance protein At1g50180 [Camellia sinensis]|uniref:AAA+ ATPase domain-containing protein n=1 Tax=Camellia sinensis var. sinensis TaxID=542762 RepID=A0A4S4E409_CAMSN|nr:putative disease resistance protein At1g50180 [Camellia sinensis]XP_028103445.1 putative disease resistance protein At1g50180 [Camellia sinensis]XP_028103453.1 putative disease resistance protein At1g50180 [Camellia sinensis]XP_028103458.1 putative disease resistance protein At1g50180 [Camellia sinensis]XP_028103467.1 putative disease resistance protein At1g50180 [Camellia sinensis]XP_028103473.1 putative disease resistance protein At1g50180 [Camellia sinensis]XP_028103480.1 putative disea